MDEAEWLACDDPNEMLQLLWDRASDRKLRLFAVACCRCSRQLLLNRDHRRALEISTRFADGLATEEELADAYQRANGYACGLYDRSKSEREIHRWAEATAVANAVAVVTPGSHMAGHAADAVWMIHRAAQRNPNRRLAGLLRDICGNPFRPVGVEASWLTQPVLSLARGIYADLAFDGMPVLGDALEEAGCTSEDVLRHCRQPGEHARGCWVVDLILGLK